MTTRHAQQYVASEWAFVSGIPYEDPFNDVTIDVIVTHEGGDTWRVPTFWAGGHEWRVRFAPPQLGAYRYETVCSDPDNPDLHGMEGELIAEANAESNPLLLHGPLRVSDDRTHLVHADGEPFLWLGDTWWLGLTARLSWPDDFRRLTADRVAKGFSVIQIVAGLYPDMPAFDPRGRNEAGHPWEARYQRINPAYFDMTDLRIQWLVREGLVPCIVGCWGFHLPWLGIERMQQHWRNLVARYGAYPVIWCLAGEGNMPYYLSETPRDDRLQLVSEWSELASFLREIDPYGHPVTIHPSSGATSRDLVTDEWMVDLDMLQTGHGGYDSIPGTIETIERAVTAEPRMPVIQGEVCYEGIMGGSHEDIQRFMFWSNMLSGAAGYTYGANGLWQANIEHDAFGASPHGAAWGDLPWDQAYQLPGSRQIGLGKQLLESYAWHAFEPHPEWVTPHAGPDDYRQPYAAGIPGKVRVVYLPRPITAWREPVYIQLLEPDVAYTALYFDPLDGTEYPLGTIPRRESFRLPLPPIMHDWVLVLERSE